MNPANSTLHLVDTDYFNTPAEQLSNDQPPIIVDLDGTLSLVDTLHEQFAVALFSKPLQTLKCLTHVTKGRGRFKHELSKIAVLDTEHIPIRQDLLDYLFEQYQAGRSLHLISAAEHGIVENVARKLNIFSSWQGSTPDSNLKGEVKRDFLLDQFPDGFVYAGDSSADLNVWPAAKAIILAGVKPGVSRQAHELGLPVELELSNPTTNLGLWIQALRLHQWSKNLLLFVPLLLSGSLTNPSSWISTFMGFAIMGLVASGSYLLNDIADLFSDRRHKTKCARPLASGALSIYRSLLMAGLLIVVPLGISWLVTPAFTTALVFYLALTFSYSVRLKKVPVLDAMVLATLYSSRLIMGMVLAGVGSSVWILTFAGFFFFSMSLGKRFVEIDQSDLASGQLISGRGYMPADASWVLSLGSASSIASILVIIQYLILEAFPSNIYNSPMFLWLLPVSVTLWVSRIWLLAVRKELDDDPVAFAIRDRVSLSLGVTLLLTFCTARFL